MDTETAIAEGTVIAAEVPMIAEEELNAERISERNNAGPCICCGTDNAKYKCPKCYLKYCSVNCCQEHKENGTCPGKPAESITAKLSHLKLSSLPTRDRDPDDPYEKLVNLIKSPNLQAWIKKLDSCAVREAPRLYDAAMESPEFVEYVQLIANLRNERGSDSSSDDEVR